MECWMEAAAHGKDNLSGARKVKKIMLIIVNA